MVNVPPRELETLRSLLVLRMEENLTFYELAERAGIPRSTLKSALDPERGNPGLKTAGAIFDGLRVSAREFFDSELFL